MIAEESRTHPAVKKMSAIYPAKLSIFSVASRKADAKASV